jgi:hypothetical protein
MEGDGECADHGDSCRLIIVANEPTTAGGETEMLDFTRRPENGLLWCDVGSEIGNWTVDVSCWAG